MIERLNSATNLIGFTIVVLGVLAELVHTGAGTPIVTGGFGLLVGKGIAQAAKE
jgi:hypothetical protein